MHLVETKRFFNRDTLFPNENLLARIREQYLSLYGNIEILCSQNHVTFIIVLKKTPLCFLMSTYIRTIIITL